MSDLKCKGDGCLLAFRCKRFTAYVADNNPPYFADAPYKVVNDILSCVMFIGLNENENGEDNTGRTESDGLGNIEETKQGT